MVSMGKYGMYVCMYVSVYALQSRCSAGRAGDQVEQVVVGCSYRKEAMTTCMSLWHCKLDRSPSHLN